VDSRRSLDLVLILRPSAEMRATADELRVSTVDELRVSTVDELRVPKFSNAMGWKM